MHLHIAVSVTDLKLTVTASCSTAGGIEVTEEMEDMDYREDDDEKEEEPGRRLFTWNIIIIRLLCNMLLAHLMVIDTLIFFQFLTFAFFFLETVLRRFSSTLRFCWVLLSAFLDSLTTWLRGLCQEHIDISTVLRIERCMLMQQAKQVQTELQFTTATGSVRTTTKIAAMDN